MIWERPRGLSFFYGGDIGNESTKDLRTVRAYGDQWDYLSRDRVS
jgi:hypothetical protein